ncbi:hypothetical protein, partial [Hydrogenophaga sp.]|uniref:hypothetical protein n=1 Tax=Hydrogenophaga sp. TaxID=1904254 RepID=UPI00286E879D
LQEGPGFDVRNDQDDQRTPEVIRHEAPRFCATVLDKKAALSSGFFLARRTRGLRPTRETSARRRRKRV